jgi:hypothetical protein
MVLIERVCASDLFVGLRFMPAPAALPVPFDTPPLSGYG